MKTEYRGGRVVRIYLFFTTDFGHFKTTISMYYVFAVIF